VSEKLDKFEPSKRIPYTAEEIGTIETIMRVKGYKAQSLLGANLAKEKIIAELAAKPRILHFATHGVMSGEIPYILNPTLILSMRERPIDTFLQSSEIEKLDLSGVELVVLSACKTGIDVSSDSEGISGIAKSFLIAGAKNVLLTYWSINDMATSAFMEHLYGEIGNGAPVAQALSKTRKQFVSGAVTAKTVTAEPSNRGLAIKQKQVASGADYALPFYWGAFALFGRD
jgi:CHAT domain-containing protein